MNNKSKNLSKIIELELELQSKDVRKNIKRLAEILHDDFYEIGSSGTLYSKKDILERLPKSEYVEMQSNNFEGNFIKDDVLLLKYDLQIFSGKELSSNSKRTSIWKLENNCWQMFFHQSTLIR